MCNGYYSVMRVLFYFGIVLMLSSFLAAAAENASHAIPGAPRTMILSAYDLWYTLWPRSLLVFELRVTSIFGSWLWDPVLLTVMKLPAWLILGGPGVALVVFNRPKRSDITDEDIKSAEESQDLYNELTKRARAENPPDEEHGYQDMMPEEAETTGDPLDPIRPTEFVHGQNPFHGKEGKS